MFKEVFLINRMIELIIDNREHDIIKNIQNSIPYIIEQLDVGDILFRQDGMTVLIIERKTVNDLKASICDGRGREQKARLLGSTPRHRILYLIEGFLDKTQMNGLPVSTLVGSLINTQLRDGIKVYKTNTIEESIEFIIKLYSKLEKDGNTYFREEEYKSSDNNYVATLKKSKKANMTPSVWMLAQLSLIPQVTEKVASVITDKYSSVNVLIKEYETTPEHLREKLLSDIIFPLTTGGHRRIGDKMSSRIYHFLYGIY